MAGFRMHREAIMTDYLLIESRSEPGDVDYSCTVAAQLVGHGHDVALFLVQNGVLRARRAAKADGLDTAASAGVMLLADDFSLRERGIGNDQLRSQIAPAPLETVVDALVRGAKVIWH
jgi:hypothetical protein